MGIYIVPQLSDQRRAKTRQPRPQGLLAFQYGGKREDPGDEVENAADINLVPRVLALGENPGNEVGQTSD